MSIKLDKVCIEEDRIYLHVVTVGGISHMFRVNEITHEVKEYKRIPESELKSFLEDFRKDWMRDHEEVPVVEV